MNSSRQNTVDIWKFYQNESRQVFDKSYPRLLYLARKIKPGMKVLNVGVGGGVFESIGLSRGLKVYSLDPDEETILMLIKRFGDEERFKVGRSDNMPFKDGMFDVVVMSEVLEHLFDSELDDTVKEVHRVLAPSGLFIGTVPCEEDLTDNMVICPHCSETFHRWEHKQSFTHGRINELLSNLFLVQTLRNKLFVYWNRQSLKSRFHLFKTWFLYQLRLNLPSGEVICFAARKCAGPLSDSNPD